MANKIELASVTDHADISVLRNDLETLRTDVISLAKHIKEEGKHETLYIKERMLEQKKRALNELSSRIDDVQDFGGRSISQLEKKVRSRPAQSIAVAFVAGILVNLVLGHKD